MLFLQKFNKQLPLGLSDLSTNKKFISGLPKYFTGHRSTVVLNFQKNQNKKIYINVTELIYTKALENETPESENIVHNEQTFCTDRGC